MNLFRLLLLLATVWLVWRLYKSARARLGQGQAPTPVAGAPEQFEPMARCATCGTHLPAKVLSPDGRCGRCAAGP